MRGAVVLLAHPSRTGLTSGEGDGGNTAWNASVRSRLYLSRPNPDGDEQPDDNQRALTRKKANYAGRGDAVDLIWRDGYFKVENSATGVFGTIERHGAQAVFLDAMAKLAAQGVAVSASPSANNFAPTQIIRAGMHGRLRKADLRAAMQALFTAGKIRTETYGRPSAQRSKLVAVTP
jgi:hypothetical protein